MPSFKKNAKGATVNVGDPLRFAHPFFTDTPIAERPVIAGIGQRMIDHIQTQLEPIPKPFRDPTMNLSEIIGQNGVSGIQQQGSLRFHTVGDTGNELSPMPELVAKAMTTDYHIGNAGNSPAFYFHLGDVNYYDNTDKGYHAQFYTPYKAYPGKIIAIPGNHDGELFKYDGSSTGQSKTLEAFQRNFCQPKPAVPPAAGTIFREMISQPAVYWVLHAPFADIIGLYSNIAENPGFISGPQIGQAQKNWLVKALADIAKQRSKSNRKALIIGTHHPQISGGGSHSGSAEMQADIDDACTKSKVMPDLVLGAHSHNYQRFTRSMKFMGKNLQIPYLIFGGGGRNIADLPAASGQIFGEFTYNKSLVDYGYALISIDNKNINISVYRVDATGNKHLFDTVQVDLSSDTLK